MVDNSDLKYEVVLTAEPNSEAKQSIKTPFDIDFSEIRQLVIEQTSEIVKRVSFYPNGLILYLESTSEYGKVRSNWPIEKDADGELVILDKDSN